MKFLDYAEIFVQAGNGGNGCISFLKRKNFFRGGPDGGDGGNGGNIWITGNKNLNTLIDFQFKKKYFAENGQNGKNKKRTGKYGEDLFIPVPLGTRISNLETNEIIDDVLYNHQKILIAQGGVHGLSNTHFKSSTNRTPYKKTNGKKGEHRYIKLELLLLANVGLFGLPNSGKSTFLQSVSSAKPKIADYPFTTLIPSLGSIKINNKENFILADLPGIITGASSGHGLGIRFLKHLEHCQLLLHIIDISSNNIKNIINQENLILLELKKYNKNLFKKPRWIVFNKIDCLTNSEILLNATKISYALQKNNNYHIISAIKKIGTRKLCKNIFKYLKSSCLNKKKLHHQNKNISFNWDMNNTII